MEAPTSSITCTLLVRRLPLSFTEETVSSFLKHFGCISSRAFPPKSVMKGCAFATFKNHAEAKCALERLHQLEVLGRRIIVEYAAERSSPQWPGLLAETKVSGNFEKNSVEKDRTVSKLDEKVDLPIHKRVSSINSRMDISYPLNPSLLYQYPPLTEGVLCNISNAIASVPKLYTQVLHLMNKMNLPAPFGELLPAPVIPKSDLSGTNLSHEATVDRGKADMLISSSSSESELESDEEPGGAPVTLPAKRAKHQVNPPTKRLKVSRLLPPSVTSSGTKVKAEDLFELTPALKGADRRISIAAPASLAPKVSSLPDPTPQPPTDLLAMVTEAERGQGPPVSGFGKILPPQKPASGDSEGDSSDDEDDQFGSNNCISRSELRKGMLSRHEMDGHPLFKKYQPGQPSSRLYIKNVAKTVDEKDLRYIFLRFVDPSNEEDMLSFDVRLMKEGRMKGQAFVTFPREEIARRALRYTNAYVLQSKPIVVSFARSAKPK